MKKHLSLVACGLLLAPLYASAQQSGNITFYGVIDAAMVYQTNVNSAGKSAISLEQGGEGFLSGSRFGLKGEEDLGGGMKAGFVLENGFLVDTGALDQQKQLFGRQAYVKISNHLGELALGRQYTSANTMAYYVDPLGVGAAPANAWLVYLTGQRFDNAISYTGNFGAWNIVAQHALGEVAGAAPKRASNSLGVKYSRGAVVAVGDVQQVNDSAQRSARIYMAGLKAALGSTGLYMYYINSKRDAGFDVTNGGLDTASITSMSTPSNATTPAGFSSVFSSQRKDDFVTLGMRYPVTSALALTAAVMGDHTTAANFSGTRLTGYAVADYAFSKRTNVYLAAARDRVSGDWSGLFGNATVNYLGGSGQKLNGKDGQTSLFAGLRHTF